jgi:retron-type reverse transcriptase
MAMSTTTIRTTTTMSGVCAAESDPMYSFRSLYDAYASCRRRKRNTINALRFESSLLNNLVSLGETLADGTYKPFRSVCFVAKQPKHREIFAADFRDRVIHHLLVPRIEMVFKPKFIHDSYACRKGKGTHAAVKRLKSFMNRISKGGRVPAWFMQFDIKSFFMSIDRGLLLRILARHIRNPLTMAIAKTIVLQDCTKDFIYKGDPRLLQRIPPHKSLFHIHEGKGLPIGNLTSQFFGNVYLNELDQFVKHTLKVQHYLRYVDDFIFLHSDRNELLATREKIGAFLKERLSLELKPVMHPKRVSEGANFLGYIVRPDYILVRNRVIGNLRARLRQFHDEMIQYKAIGNRKFAHIHLREEHVRQLRQTLASYLGHFKHADSYRLIRGLFEKYAYLKDIFSIDDLGSLLPLYEPPFKPATLRGQYTWAAKRYVDHCIFFQVGSFCEFYGAQAGRYGRFFGLKPMAKTRMNAAQCGFPMRYLKEFKEKALQVGLPYVVVAEQGFYPSGLKKRTVTEIFDLSRREL